jgi:molybdopterin-guanine dinucleotide biosynthesis protein A
MPLPPGTDLAWLEDDVPGEGPLGGLLTALRAAGDRDALVLAGDMPFVSQAFLRHLVFSADLHRRSFDIIVPRWGPYLEPLHAIYSPSCLGRLRELRTLHGTLSGRRVTDLFTDLRVTEIMETEIRLFGDPRTLFLNLNTPEDLARAETMAASEEP